MYFCLSRTGVVYSFYAVLNDRLDYVEDVLFEASGSRFSNEEPEGGLPFAVYGEGGGVIRE